MVIRKETPFDDAFYHIILRGNNRSFILQKNEDKIYFLALLKRYKKLYAFDLLHYCIMNNHVHLAIQIRQGDHLSKLMQGLSQSYTNHWKRTHHFIGHLWHDPYRRFLIQDSSYLLECGRYIERNPVRAGIVSRPEDYFWSSYTAYLKGETNGLTDFNPEFLNLSNDVMTRQKLYESYVASPRPYETLLDAALENYTLRKINPWQTSNQKKQAGNISLPYKHT